MADADGVRTVVVVTAPDPAPSTDGVTGFCEGLTRSIAHRGAAEPRIDVRPLAADQIDSAAAVFSEVNGALFVISAIESIHDTVVEAWDLCDDLGLPRAIVICDIDSTSAATESLIEECQEALGDMVPVLAVHLPVLSDDEHPIGLIDLLSDTITDYSSTDYSSGRPHRIPAEDRHRDLVRDERTWLLEAIIAETESDDLVSAYLAGEYLDPATLTLEFRDTVRRGRVHPILLTAAVPPDFGMDNVADIVTFGFSQAANARP